MNSLQRALVALTFTFSTALGAAAGAQENPALVPDASPSTAEAPIAQAGGYSNISNALLQKMLDEGVAVIDIRREDEWRKTGIIEGVKPITFFLANGELNPNFVPEFTAAVSPDQPVALICRSGNRTQVASSAIVKHLDYTTVYNVSKGIKGWLAEKRPVVAYK